MPDARYQMPDLTISDAKPIIPVCEANREGDHAQGVVVGSSLVSKVAFGRGTDLES